MSATDTLPEPDLRAEPLCQYFGQCGGCSLQHFAEPAYLAYKIGLVEAALRYAHVEAQIEPMLSAHGDGRRRATLHAQGKDVGYMMARSHTLLDIAACPILVPALAQRAPAITRAIAATIGDCDVALTASDTGLDIAIRSDRKIKPERLTILAQRLGVARMSVNGEIVITARPPAIKMGKALVELPIGSFLQATAAAEATLAALVADGVGKATAIADLFCGLGPFALRLAAQARIYAADSDRPGIAALQKAVRGTQGLKPVTAVVRDLMREPLVPVELKPYEAVVFDPPRAGAEAQARELAKSTVKTVVAVSCEPKTFGRDAAILIAGGFRLERLTPVDQFAWSSHVELVGVFRR